jgi:hypothetical protein
MTNRVANLVFYVAAVPYLVWLSKYGFLYDFTSRTEPDYFPLAMVVGPMSMLPAILVSLFFPRVASIWLAISSLLGLLGVILSNVWGFQPLLAFVAVTTIPMLICAAYLYHTVKPLRRVSGVMR